MPRFGSCDTLYLAEGQNGIKVGITGRLPARLVDLAADHGPVTLIRSWFRPGDAQQVEYTVKGILAHRRSRGFECFSVSTAEAIAAVERAISRVERRLHRVSPTEARIARDAAREKRERETRETIAEIAKGWGISRQTLYIRFPRAKIKQLRRRHSR